MWLPKARHTTGEVAPYEVQGYIPQHAPEQEIAELALDGFQLMGNAPSTYNEFRTSLTTRIIGQPDAVDALISALDRVSVRRNEDNRPIASFAFLGPSGVGKTEMARAIADNLDENTGSLVKIDCSSYSSGHEVATLTGAPQGYLGYGDRVVFDPDVIEEPGTVVLFDEIEKGAPKLHKLLLQIMDDGLVTLTDGTEVNFRDTIVIMTSNLGAKDMTAALQNASIGFGTATKSVNLAEQARLATNEFDKFFSPEFVNRLTDKIIFRPLSQEGLSGVLNAKLAAANMQYEAELGIRLSLSNGAHNYLVSKGSTQLHMGARPLVRLLESEIHTPFGRHVAANNIPEGTEVRVFHRDELPANLLLSSTDTLVLTSRQDDTIKKIPTPAEEEDIEATTKVEAESLANDENEN